jgi:predicted transcriptional regulator YdeE
MKCNKKQEQSPVCAGKQEHGAVTKTNKKSKNNKNRKKKFFQKSKRKTNTKANLKKKKTVHTIYYNWYSSNSNLDTFVFYVGVCFRILASMYACRSNVLT